MNLAEQLSQYSLSLSYDEVNVAMIGASVTEAIDSREQARELGVAYAGECVTVRPSGRARGL